MNFTLKTTIKASAKEIYSAWLNSDGHTKMTGGKATASQNIGDTFSAWDDYIQGKNLILEENKKIVQAWRTSGFKENEEDSQIEILLFENDGITELVLKHTNVPEGGEHYIKGWEEHYFQPMKDWFAK